MSRSRFQAVSPAGPKKSARMLLSMPHTLSPRRAKNATTSLPMSPPEPVTRIFMLLPFAGEGEKIVHFVGFCKRVKRVGRSPFCRGAKSCVSTKGVGPPLRVLPRVVLAGSAFGLVAACHKGPAGRGQAAIRSGSPSGPPNARQLNSVQSITSFRAKPHSQTSTKVYFFLLFNSSTIQRFNSSTAPRGCRHNDVGSCSCFVKAVTPEGVAQDTAGRRPRRPERGGSFPP